MPPSEIAQCLRDVPERRTDSRIRGDDGEGQEASRYVHGVGLADGHPTRDVAPKRVGVVAERRACLREQEPAPVPANETQLLN